MSVSGKITRQVRHWSGDFGREYTDRNPQSVEEMEQLYVRNYGVSCRTLDEEFIGHLPRDARILEVGSNVGMQLSILQEMGFRNLYGLELQRYAVELSKRRTQDIDIIQGSVLDIPFRDRYFDLVFTFGLLGLISPDDLAQATSEVHRCTRQYIFGFECFSDPPTEVVYRGESRLLWRRDFASFFVDAFSDVELVKERTLGYVEHDNANDHGDAVDQMYLLERVDT